ncbi:hypothetical protein Hanom_Chr15g01357851 [Helianthus anomalus]
MQCIYTSSRNMIAPLGISLASVNTFPNNLSLSPKYFDMITSNGTYNNGAPCITEQYPFSVRFIGEH